MNGKIITYTTEHFKFRVPIDEWNQNKIPLPEGAGAKFIAPNNLAAILLKPFRNKPPAQTFIFGEEWVGKEIRHFPYCKELFEFINWLKEKYGWYIIPSWYSVTESIALQLMKEQGIRRQDISYTQLSTILQETYKFILSGYVGLNELRGGGRFATYWASVEHPTNEYAHYMVLEGGGSTPRCNWVKPRETERKCDIANPVRCVSE